MQGKAKRIDKVLLSVSLSKPNATSVCPSCRPSLLCASLSVFLSFCRGLSLHFTSLRRGRILSRGGRPQRGLSLSLSLSTAESLYAFSIGVHAITVGVERLLASPGCHTVDLQAEQGHYGTLPRRLRWLRCSFGHLCEGRGLVALTHSHEGSRTHGA